MKEDDGFEPWQTRKLADYHKRRIAATLAVSPAQRASMMALIEKAAQQVWRDREKWSLARCKSVELKEQMLTMRLIPYASRGAPPKIGIRSYISTVVSIYEGAIGKRLGRSWVDLSTDKLTFFKEKRLPFFVACLSAIGVRRSDYPTGIITEVLIELHPQAKRGRPPKK